MASVVKKGEINYKSFHPRIVVKFNDLIDLPYKSNAVVNDFFLKGPSWHCHG